MKLLYLEDDDIIAKATQRILRTAHILDWCKTVSEAKTQAEINNYDMFVIDLTLPDGDGAEFATFLREKLNCKQPILIVTGNSHKENIVSTLDSGADDYLVKPFSALELMARIRALGRRASQEPLPESMQCGNTTIDFANRAILCESFQICPRKKEFDILAYLCRNKTRVTTREELYENLWDSASQPMSNSLDVHIGNIRRMFKKIQSTIEIEKIQGVGYKTIINV